MVEFNKDNRFPFLSKKSSVSICTNNHDDLYEVGFIYDRIIEKFPELKAEIFYSKIRDIESENTVKDDDMMANASRRIKEASDCLFVNIRMLFMDENFIHMLHDRWGYGISKVLQTLYAVYGYYFYTGKRTANIIKKIINGYQKQPEY